MTWIVTGESLTDDELELRNRQKFETYRARWGCGVRPDELGDFVSNLEAIIAGHEPAVDEDFPDNKWVAKQRARWVDGIQAAGKDLVDVLQDARRELNQHNATKERYHVLFELICAECRNSGICMYGHREGEKKGIPEIIPASYFHYPVYCYLGSCPWGVGHAIVPKFKYSLEDRLFRNAEERPVLRDVTMSSDAAMTLRSKCELLISDDGEASTQRKTLASAESKCLNRLISEIKASPERSDKSKLAWYRELAAEIPGLGDPDQEQPSEPFNRAWRSANAAVPGAKWHQPGRKKSRTQNRGPN